MGFSSRGITLMIHFLSSVTDFYGGSDMVPWSHLRHPFLGRMWTDLTSELTHFNFIIRQTVGHSVHHHFAISRRSCCPCESLELSPLLKWSHAEQPEIPFSSMLKLQLPHVTWRMPQAGPCFSGRISFLLLVLWWGQTCCAPNSFELEQLFESTWHDRLPSPLEGATHDLLALKLRPSFIFFVFFAPFHQLVPHGSPISCVLPSPK